MAQVKQGVIRVPARGESSRPFAKRRPPPSRDVVPVVDDGGDPGGNGDGVPRARKAPPGLGSPQASYFEGRRSTVRKDILWVHHNLDAGDIDWRDAPSIGAWSLREWVRASPENRSLFYRSFLGRLLPSRSQIDEKIEREDDGAGVESTIERIQRMRSETADA